MPGRREQWSGVSPAPCSGSGAHPGPWLRRGGSLQAERPPRCTCSSPQQLGGAGSPFSWPCAHQGWFSLEAEAPPVEMVVGSAEPLSQGCSVVGVSPCPTHSPAAVAGGRFTSVQHHDTALRRREHRSWGPTLRIETAPQGVEV